MADLIRVPPIGSPVITDAAALALKALANIELQVAIGVRSIADSEDQICWWERQLRIYGGVPLGSLVRDGVDHV